VKNPLSPLTYYRRNKRRALMLTILLALTVMGLYLVFGLLLETYITPFYTINRYLSKFSLVQPEPGATLDPAVVTQIRAHPDVAQVLPQNNVEIAVPTGVDTLFRLIGLQEADVPVVLAQCGVTLVEGRLPQPHTNGLALSQELATALDLKIGDTLKRTENETGYANIASPLELVGILSGDVRLGIVSYEYLNSHERYRDLARYGVLVIARPSREAAVDSFLRQTVRSSRTETVTYQLLKEDLAQSQALLYKIGTPLVLLVTAAITLVVGAINRLAFLRRLPEFGTLYAVGRSKGWLARRLTMETAGLALAGCALGILLAWVGMALLNAAVYTPRGLAYNPFQVTVLSYVAPIPLAVIGFTLFTVTRALERMDAVAIVERGELSLEGSRSGRARSGHVEAGGLPRPLASTTFYRRHKGQAAVLIGAMALMIVGASIFIFGVEAFDDARQPLLAHLSRVSLVSPNGLPLETTAIAQIRAHPAVERVIPIIVFSPLGIFIPPPASNYPVEAYGVAAEDMAYLVELYGLELAEGHLPRPNTNDIVIPWTVAQNRDIQVGDVIGNRNHPVHPDAPTLPSELVVSGIFAPAENPADDIWLSFMSLEFAENYPDSWKVDLSLIVVPKTGQGAALNAWLESQVAGENRLVFTYNNQQALFQRQASTILFSLSLVESIIALVAALALAGLNYIFVVQRQAEFGVLNALGFSRLRLVGRIVRETLFTVGAAWLVAMLGCAVALLGLQYGLYIPSGLKLNLFNLTPWFYTLPVPAVVLAVSAGAVAWALSRLDPVAIIERR
jgi:putative ABC transport system permease protein